MGADDVSLLIVDDRPENLIALEALLEPLGHRIVHALSAEKALRHLLTRDFAVILLDVEMPGIDGYEAARLIKTRARSRVTPIIFLTALDQDRRHATLGYQSGAVDYLFKPLDPELLRAKVSAFVALGRNRDAAARQARRVADLEILASEERFRLVQKATSDVIWDWDLIANRLEWSELATEAFSISPEELTRGGDWWESRVHADDRESVVHSIQDVISGGGDGHTWSAQYRFRSGPLGADGVAEYRTFLDRGYVARDAAGRAMRMIGAMQDVTARARAHAEAENARRDAERARLEAEAAREDAERAREDADRSRAAAEAANQAKSAFLATMSHELRTPLNAQIGYAQLLELGVAGPLNDQQRDFLTRLAASSRHLLGLIDDVLDLSKVDAGETQVARDELLTGTAVAAALDLTLPQAGAREVTLVHEEAGDEGVAYLGDEHRVRQILVNLVGNAVKFTEAGGTVTVACGIAPPPPSSELQGAGPWAFVRVTDTGIGIPAREQARVFEAFHQVEVGSGMAYTRTQGGTGLGLTISRRLARLMGGDLTLESEPGVGSVFTLWLPSAESAARAAGDRAPRADAPREPGVERRATVLDAPGLDAVGAALIESIRGVIVAYCDRLRADPEVSRATRMRSTQLEDHAVTLCADLAQSLRIVAEAGPEAAELLRDGSAIQRTIAEAHGARRFAQGWTEDEVRRDHLAFREELERGVRGQMRLGDVDGGSADAAIAVLVGLVDRAEAISVRAWRRSADGLAR